MAIINEVLYYKGTTGIYAYTGSTPVCVSDNFGTRRFQNASAGTDGVRYYISMQDVEDGSWHLFAFDQTTGIWLREDETHAAAFAWKGSALHFLSAVDNKIYQIEQEGGEEGALPWMALFAPFDDSVYGKRGYSKLWLKLELAAGAWVKAEISADNGPFRQVGVWSNRNAQSFTIPIFPGRCDTFRLRLSGKGQCVVKSLVREFDIGSER